MAPEAASIGFGQTGTGEAGLPLNSKSEAGVSSPGATNVALAGRGFVGLAEA